MTTTATHEEFIHAVRNIVLYHTDKLSNDERTKLAHAKLIYGVGRPGVRGITVYSAWSNDVGTVDVCEISAATEENWIQLAGTVIHELAHILAGSAAGHGKDWKNEAVRLGFRTQPKAAGQVYTLAMFPSTLRTALYVTARGISDGNPAFMEDGQARRTPKPCGQGTGSRGGQSRGKGSGSRMRLYECECPKPRKVRTAADDLNATCNDCGSPFTMK